MKFNTLLLSILIYAGMVDSVVGDYASVELSNSHGEIKQVEIPLLLFPCDIKEGDFFYTFELDGVREIRCGEPPPE
jgi:hypothetical protein